jgi:K+-sensing histidine kinase KdpD
MQNLLENADKYSPTGGFDVRVTTEDGQAIIDVQDRGPGVEPGELNLIFHGFYRSPSTAANAPGKGLGFPLRRRLMEAMGGSIEAAPREGGGLTLRLSLPIVSGPTEDLPRLA